MAERRQLATKLCGAVVKPGAAYVVQAFFDWRLYLRGKLSPFISKMWTWWVIRPATSLPFRCVAYDLHRGAIGSEFVSHKDFRLAVPFHRFSHEFKGCN